MSSKSKIVFKSKLDNIYVTQSIYRVGRCIDNGPTLIEYRTQTLILLFILST